MRLPGCRRPRPPPRPSSPPVQGPARSVDIPVQAALRWNELASAARVGLHVASDDAEPAVSCDSLSFDGRLITPPGSDVPACWVRPASDSAGSVPSAGPSPALVADNPPDPAEIPHSSRGTPRSGRGTPRSGRGTPGSSRGTPRSIRGTPRTTPSPSGLPALHVPPSPTAALSDRWDYAELSALKKRFQALDEEGKGFLTRDQFHDLFSSIVENPAIGPEQSPMLNFAFSLFQSSGETLNLKEFVAGMTILSKGSEEERLRYLFHMYDSTNTGYLTANEIRQVFHVMSSYATSLDFNASDSLEGASLSRLRRGDSKNLEELALKTLKEHDLDGDGRIGFDEFSHWCSQDPVAKTWMDMLCFDTARGIERLKDENEKALLARELDSLGFADSRFWRTSFNLDCSAGTSSGILPPTISHGSVPSSARRESGVSRESQVSRESGLSEDTTTSVNAMSPIENLLPSRPSHSRTLTENAIGGFEIDFHELHFVREIGSGSFATVWECTWLSSPVAVKVFKSGPRLIVNEDGTASTGDAGIDARKFSEDGESFEPDFESIAGGMSELQETRGPDGEMSTNRIRFLTEVALLKSIRHPNLLLYMGACVDPRYPLCIVSELIDGGSLFELLHGKKTKLNIRQKLMLTMDIARGMRYLHGRDPIVLHRDLKSANILVEEQNDESFKGKIIDFGLSKLSSTQQSLVPGGGRGLTGSLVTMAPEVMNEQKYMPRSDVYSFGIVCWEIFCGRVPFGKFTQVAQLIMKVAVRGERPAFRPEDAVPRSVKQLIQACWEQDMNKRPDFEMIANMLDRISRDEGVSE